MGTITIEVVYATLERQLLLALSVEEGTTIIAAIKQTNILQQFPEIDLSKNKIGIHGKVVRKPDETQLREHDRIEIYRPLIKPEK